MLANVEAMLRTIQNFLRLATPEERIEFASALYSDKELYSNVQAKVPTVPEQCGLSNANNARTENALCSLLPRSVAESLATSGKAEDTVSHAGVCVGPSCDVVD